jgi:hypothetical protein
MMRAKIAVFTVILASVTALVGGFSSGPLPGLTGAPNEFDCTLCHADNPPNTGPGTFVISGPATVSPGETIFLNVAFTGPAQAAPWHGFQITAQDSQQNYVGIWGLVDPNTTQINSTDWVNHTFAGVALSQWTVKWTAPSPFSLTQVIFYASGNEANMDGTAAGDNIYTATLTVPVLQPFSFTATTTGGGVGDFNGVISGAVLGGIPQEVGNLAVVLVTLDPTPGGLFGITPDAITDFIIGSPLGSIPFFNQFFGPATTNTAAFPPGTLTSLAGMPITMVGLTVNLATVSLVNLSPVVQIIP